MRDCHVGPDADWFVKSKLSGVSDGGKAITTRCTACHQILAQGTPPKLAFSSSPDGLRFEIPRTSATPRRR